MGGTAFPLGHDGNRRVSGPSGMIASGEVVGRYTIKQGLTRRGGMSQVYLAYETSRPQHQVALKLTPTVARDQALYRDVLRREVEALTRLRHPGIVRILPQRILERTIYLAQANYLPGKPYYFAMEYLDGPPLQGKDLAQSFPLEWRAELCYQLLIIVYFMHSSGYAHGDLKFENVILRTAPAPDEIPMPVLVDFGTVMPVGQPPTLLAASVNYAPPEVVRALRQSPPDTSAITQPEKTDIWALGAMFYQLFTGRPLVASAEPGKAADAVEARQWEAPGAVNRELPRQLGALIETIPQPEPKARPTVTQILAEFEENIPALLPPRVTRSAPPGRSFFRRT